MKKALAVLMCIIALLLAACTPGATGVTTPSAGTESTQDPQEGKKDAYAENGGMNVNYLCGIDMFGRSFGPVSGMDENKKVGMFYFIWHGESGKTTFDNTKQLAEDPDTFWDMTKNVGSFHYWGEPLFGYYLSWDKWVIARHIEMLTSAGVDYLVFDATNSFTYKQAYTAVFKVLQEYKEAGWNVPKTVFYTNSYSMNTMNNLYEQLYSKGLYKELWYCPDGEKPMIIGNPDDQDYKGDRSFLDFFDVRLSQWPDAAYNPDGIPWMEWTYPQPVHNGFMNVAVAQHPQLPFSASITDRSRNWGRGYNFETKENVEADSRKGTNFQSQWDTVLANKDKVDNVFVTGWNEWIAIKLDLGDGKPWFVDCATEEFSRDIEPMKGGYEDAFYLQLCDNIRRYKGQHDEVRLPDKKTVDINGEVSQWDGVTSVYNCVTQQSVKRTGKSVDRRTNYALDAARNNIQQVKIANDADKLYFCIKCENAVTDADKADFMNIYLGIGELALKGWNGYEYVLNCGDGSLSSLDAQGKRTRIANIEVKVSGNTVQASVSRSDIAAMEAAGIYFKVADAVSSTDIMDTYTYGKSLPMGRLSYYYYFG